MNEKQKLPLIDIFAMPIILIIASYTAHIHFNILSAPLYISVFLYPLLYLFMGIIVKKSDYKRAISILAFSLVIQSLVFVIQWVLLDKMDCFLMVYSFVSVLLCGLLFIYSYTFLRQLKIDTYIPVFLLIFVLSMLDNEFFSLMIGGSAFGLSVLVRLLYACAIPVLLARNTTKKAKKS